MLKSASGQAMSPDDPTMRIGEVASRAGVRVSLVRYYDRIGLLSPAGRVGGQRRYDVSALRRLAVIDVAQRAGLSLAEIHELLEHGNEPMSQRLRDLAERRLPEIDALIDRAERVRTWLKDAASCGCESIDGCALFDEPALLAARGARPPAAAHAPGLAG
jgi:MerR family redox-sensitive transcriptional activator SoxR